MSTAIATGMSVSVHRKSFLSALNAVAGVCPSKSPKPILQSVKFVACDDEFAGVDGSSLWATDLDVSIRHLVRLVKVYEPGAVILNPSRLKEIFSKATCEDLTICVEDDKVKIRGKGVKYDLPSEDPDLFPTPPTFTAEGYHVVAPADLRQVIQRTIYAVDETPGSRYALGGVLAELRSDSILMVSTDGRRLSEATAPVEVVGSPGEFTLPSKNAPVLGLKFLGLLTKTIADDDPPVHISVKAESSVTVRTDRATIYGRLVEGRFPAYLDMFKVDSDAKLTLKVGPFREAIEQAAIMRSEESKAVEFVFSEGKLVLTAQASDVGKSEIEAEIDYAGPTAESAFDPQYLLEPLRSIGDDSVIEMAVSRAGANVLKTDGFRAAVMPITKDR